MNKNSRIVEFDILKGLGIICVIAGHIAQNYDNQKIMQIFYSFHMPLFFIISGYFVSTRKNIKDFCVSRACKILKAYVVACVGVIAGRTLICYVKYRTGVLALREAFKWIYISIYGIGNGKGSIYIDSQLQICHTDEIGMLWFLLALLWAQCLVRMFLKFSERKCCLLVLITTIVGLVSVNYIWFPFSIQNGMAATIWIYIGYRIKILQLMDNACYSNRKNAVIIVCIIIWAISILWGQTELYKNYYKLGLLDMGGALAGCIVLFWSIKKVIEFSQINSKCTSYFAWVGRNSILFYIVHYWEQKISPNNTVALLTNRYIGINKLLDFFISVGLITLICTGAVRSYELLISRKL